MSYADLVVDLLIVLVGLVLVISPFAAYYYRRQDGKKKNRIIELEETLKGRDETIKNSGQRTNDITGKLSDTQRELRILEGKYKKLEEKYFTLTAAARLAGNLASMVFKLGCYAVVEPQPEDDKKDDQDAGKKGPKIILESPDANGREPTKTLAIMNLPRKNAVHLEVLGSKNKVEATLTMDDPLKPDTANDILSILNGVEKPEEDNQGDKK